MKKLSTNEIRQTWLDFFSSKNHHFLPPVSLIPVNDPSLLWINSGVATLKSYFDGRETPPAPRLVNSQKAIRTNDIENVGVTARHQTMFEMLGNFSIGDYFKKEAIEFAWELLTSTQWFAIPPQKLYITVYEDDQEAFDIWTKNLKVDSKHVFPMQRKTNFWDVGMGPCGPCTEIFFDRGAKWDPQNIGPRLIRDDLENDRYVEIWNIVFSQFNNDGSGNCTDLPRKNIDTGAGLERLASIFQDTATNFETDIFWPMIKKLETYTATNFRYSIENYFHPDSQQTKINTAFKVIVDHIRAIVFATADGIFPGNKDRGYIIRRLIRRAETYGFELQIREAFLYKLVDEVIFVMNSFYPDLKNKRDLIKATIRTEENKFRYTLERGYELLSKIIAEQRVVSGKNAWLLFESFGFPIELTLEIAEKEHVEVNLTEFENLQTEAKTLARNTRKNLQVWNKQNALYTNLNVASEFTGYDETIHHNAQILCLFDADHQLGHLTNQTGFVILNKTPFYAEKGGQVGDTGNIIGPAGTAIVLDTQQGPNNEHIHQIQVHGDLKINDFVTAIVDEEKRIFTMKNHSGTHLIHWALRSVLGTTIMQAGSYNDENGLRMDFTFHRLPSVAELDAAEKLVLTKIREGYDREVYYCSMEEAVEKYKALAFFADKYTDIVRVVKFGDFSVELCGGTHVANTREIEDFIIVGTESKGSGLYRIKCLTSTKTVREYLETQFATINSKISQNFDKYLKTTKMLSDKNLETQFAEIKKLTVSKENLVLLKSLSQQFQECYQKFAKKLDNLITQDKLKKYSNLKPTINKEGINEIRLFTKGLTPKELKQLADNLRNKFSDVILILGSENLGQNFLVTAVSESLQDKYSALELLQNQTGLETQGGGNKALAQGKYRVH